MDDIRRQVESAIARPSCSCSSSTPRPASPPPTTRSRRCCAARHAPACSIANKADNQTRVIEANRVLRARPGRAVPVSAINGAGVGELLDIIDRAAAACCLRRGRRHDDEDACASPSSAGPTSANRRCSTPSSARSASSSATSPAPRATPSTRRSSSTATALTLIDTAGIRRPGRVEGSIEHYSVMRSKDALERADIAVVRVRRLGASSGRRTSTSSAWRWTRTTGIVVCGNKWDLMRRQNRTGHSSCAGSAAACAS